MNEGAMTTTTLHCTSISVFGKKEMNCTFIRSSFRSSARFFAIFPARVAIAILTSIMQPPPESSLIELRCVCLVIVKLETDFGWTKLH
jgi:hypothetical protein